MFCQNCGTDVTNMKYCPKCGKAVNTKTAMPKNPRNWKPLTDKDNRMYYIVFSGLSTLWLAIYGFIHYMNSVEKYEGNGLEYITNRAMAQLLGKYIGIALLCGYIVYKGKIKLSISKMITSVATSIISQIIGAVIGFILMFFLYAEYIGTSFSDVEMFEILKGRCIVIEIILSAVFLLFGYAVYTQKKAGIRTKEQELRSSVLIPSILAIFETFILWKIVL